MQTKVRRTHNLKCQYSAAFAGNSEGNQQFIEINMELNRVFCSKFVYYWIWDPSKMAQNWVAQRIVIGVWQDYYGWSILGYIIVLFGRILWHHVVRIYHQLFRKESASNDHRHSDDGNHLKCSMHILMRFDMNIVLSFTKRSLFLCSKSDRGFLRRQWLHDSNDFPQVFWCIFLTVIFEMLETDSS